MKGFMCCTLLALYGTAVALAGNGLDVQTDVRVGYSFLSSEDHTYFRNHLDLSEGELIQNLKLSVRQPDDAGWFSRFSLEARTGDRLDTGRMIRFAIEKSGQWKLTVKQRQDQDWYADPSVNFGASNRNVTRSSLAVDFRYTGFSHINLFAGYGLYETKGDALHPTTQWLDVFALNLKRDVSRESFYMGARFHQGPWQIGLRQSFVTIDRPGEIQPIPVQNAGLSGQPIRLTPSRSGKISADAPVTTLTASYSGSRIMASLQAGHTDGSIDTDVLDVKSFVFEDVGSRNDFVATMVGSADTPLDTASLAVTFRLNDQWSLGYDLSWRSLETETSLTRNLDWILFGTADTPVSTISSSEERQDYYQHDRTAHSLFLRWQPTHSWDITLKGRVIDETYTMGNTKADATDTDTSTDRVELRVRYRFQRGSITGSAFTENIDDPLFRTAGDSRDGFSLSGNWMLSDRWALSGLVAKVTRDNHDPTIQLNDESTLYDLSVSFTPSDHGSLSIGYSRSELDFSTLVFLAESTAPLTDGGTYETTQNGWYANGLWSGNRWQCRALVFYLDDSGRSLPLSSLQSRLSLQWKISDSWFALVGVRYYDYSEDADMTHDYNLNQVIVGVRWVSR